VYLAQVIKDKSDVFTDTDPDGFDEECKDEGEELQELMDMSKADNWEMYDFTRDSIWFTMGISMFRTQVCQKAGLRHVPKALLRSFCEVVH